MRQEAEPSASQARPVRLAPAGLPRSLTCFQPAGWMVVPATQPEVADVTDGSSPFGELELESCGAPGKSTETATGRR
jgi:hypothetical protein